jgi:transcriptional regulator
MYVPSAFAENRLDVLHRFMREHAFATLVTNAGSVDGGPQVSHLPMLLLPSRGKLGALQLHFARPNEHWKALAEGKRSALAIFHGPHGYISPAWYASPQAVPTWNYTVVHARGTPRLLHDDTELSEHLLALVSAYESGRPDGWDVDRLPAEMFAKLRGAVVGFEMEITHLEGKWKLGQNRPRADTEGAIAGLRRAGGAESQELADWMAAALAEDHGSSQG